MLVLNAIVPSVCFDSARGLVMTMVIQSWWTCMKGLSHSGLVSPNLRHLLWDVAFILGALLFHPNLKMVLWCIDLNCLRIQWACVWWYAGGQTGDRVHRFWWQWIIPSEFEADLLSNCAVHGAFFQVFLFCMWEEGSGELIDEFHCSSSATQSKDSLLPLIGCSSIELMSVRDKVFGLVPCDS